MKQQAIAESKPERPSPRLLSAKWDDRDTFSVPEVAQILDVAVWSAWAAVKRGEIGTVRLGHRVIVPRYVVEQLLTVA